MSSVPLQREFNAPSPAVLTIVPADAAPGHVLREPLNIVPAEDESVEPVRPRAAGADSPAGSQLFLDVLMGLCGTLHRMAETAIRFLGQVKVRRAAKRLTVRESVSLGEKRFVAIVQVDGQQFLLGGAPNSVSMLAQLAGEPMPQQTASAFSHALKRHYEADRNFA